MMVIRPVRYSDVQVNFGFDGKRFQKVTDEICRETEQVVLLKGHVQFGVSPAADVEGHHCQRIIHGNGGIGHADDTSFIPHRLHQGFTQANSHVFDEMMLVVSGGG